MKRLVVIAEGDTEKKFVDDILIPYFRGLNLNNGVSCFKIKPSGGGISNYAQIKENILGVVYEHDVIVTTMIDYFRLPSSFPGTGESRSIQDHFERVKLLERKMKDEIEQTQGRRFDNFIPNIQLHEFEALIFSSLNGIDVIPLLTEKGRKSIQSIISQYPNPEDIDDAPDTAPSKRLKSAIPGYNKILHGNLVLKSIGMETILDKCPHFRNWVETLVTALREN